MGLTAEQRGQRKESGNVKTEQWKASNLSSRKKTDRKEKSRAPKGPMDNKGLLCHWDPAKTGERGPG